MATVPGPLIWEIVKKNNSFLVKEFGNGTASVKFTKEPNNLTNLHSYKHSVLVLPDVNFCDWEDERVPVYNRCSGRFLRLLLFYVGFVQDITKPIDEKTCELSKRWRFSFSALKLK